MKDYIPGQIENSAKFEILFCILKESINLGDRLLLFSQSLITLDLVEQYLQMENVPGETQKWAKNISYYRKWFLRYLCNLSLALRSRLEISRICNLEWSNNLQFGWFNYLSTVEPLFNKVGKFKKTIHLMEIL